MTLNFISKRQKTLWLDSSFAVFTRPDCNSTESVVGDLAHFHDETFILVGTVAVGVAFIALADWGVLLLNHLIWWLAGPSLSFLLQKLHSSHQSFVLFSQLPLLRVLSLAYIFTHLPLPSRIFSSRRVSCLINSPWAYRALKSGWSDLFPSCWTWLSKFSR